MVEYDENSYAAELKKKPICRFCLSQEDTLTNIYSTNNTNSQVALSMQIMACVSIEVIHSSVFMCVHAECGYMWIVSLLWFSSFVICMKTDGDLHINVSAFSIRVFASRHWGWRNIKNIHFHGFFPLWYMHWQGQSEDSVFNEISMPNQPHTMGVCIGRVKIFPNLSRTSCSMHPAHSLLHTYIYVCVCL